MTVAVGDRLPDLEVTLTAERVRAGATASRVHAPVHHDPDAARAAGAADIFLDTSTQQALVVRALTDWAGPTARVVRLNLKMRRPVCAGETVTISGEVTDVAEPVEEVSVSLVLTVDGEARTLATATLAAWPL